MNKKKNNKQITAVLMAENGFYKKIKLGTNKKDIPMTIKIPFMYKLRVSSPLFGDRVDLSVTPCGEFRFGGFKRGVANYRIYNLSQILEPKIID